MKKIDRMTKRNVFRWFKISLLPALVIPLIFLTISKEVFFVNFTPSMPIGIWRVESARSLEDLRVGDQVVFCPPDTLVFRAAKKAGYIGYGTCRGGYTRLLKQVAAMEGDRITIGEGVEVNGKPIEAGGISESVFDRLDIPRPVSQTLVPSQLWLVGTASTRSFDSRYFGPIESKVIEARVSPLIVW